MTPEQQARALRQAERDREGREILARIRAGRDASPPVMEKLDQLAGEIDGLKATLSAAYEEAGLSEHQARPVLTLHQGGAA